MTSPMMLKRWIPAAVTAAVTVAGVLVLAGPAFAHVGITSDSAVAGQPATITLSVPNEESDAGTVAVDLRFPDGQPLTNVTVAETPGWNSAVDATGVVWTGGPLTGDARVEFTFTGTLPANVTELVFRVLQTYDNGEIARWIEATPPGGAEPEFPAPVLAVAPGPAVEAPVAPTTTTTIASDHDEHSEEDESPVVAPIAADDDDDDGDNNIAVIAVITGALVAVAAVGGALIYRRSRPAA